MGEDGVIEGVTLFEDEDIDKQIFNRHLDVEPYSAGAPRYTSHMECIKCGGKDFKIRFGYYAVLAECSPCRRAAEIYTG